MKKGSLWQHKIDFWVGVPLVLFFCLFKKKRKLPQEKPKTILIFNPASIGDSLLSSALCQALKNTFPDTTLTYLCSPSNQKIVHFLKGVDKTKGFTSKNLLRWVLFPRLKKKEVGAFDWVIDISPWPRVSALSCFFLCGKFKIGFKTPKQFRHYLYDQSVLHRNDQHEVDNFYDLIFPLLKKFGQPVLPRPFSQLCTMKNYPLRPAWQEQKKHQNWTADPKLLSPSEDYVLFHPWPSGVKAELKTWPEKNWVQLATLLPKNLKIIISGSKEDFLATESLRKKIAEIRSEWVCSFAGKFTLLEWIPILQKAKVVISVNTGFMHLAAMLDKPMIALHGPTQPKRWGPLSAKAVVVQSETKGCGYLDLGFEYPKNPPPCMDGISVEKVFSAFSALL